MEAARLGMTEDEFWDCTPSFFFARSYAARTRTEDEWEQTRWLGFVVARLAGAKNIRKPSDLLPFAWDKKPVLFKIPTGETLDRMIKMSDDADETLKKVNPKAYAAFMAGKKKSAATTAAD